jgi:hypothetical protein
MAIDTTQLTDFTWAQIKLAAKHAMVSAAVGGASLSIGGKTIGRITIAEAKALYELADANEQIEAGAGTGGIALVRYGERV